MIDIVTLSVIVLYSILAYIGISEQIISISTVIRGLLVLYPAIFYKKDRAALVSALSCNIAIVAANAVTTIAMSKKLGMLVNITEENVRKISGVVDYVIVYIFFMLLCYVIYENTSSKLAESKTMDDINYAKFTLTCNYIYTNMIVVIAFIITGIWDNNLFNYVAPIVGCVIAITILHFIFLTKYKELWVDTVRRVSNIVPFKAVEKEKQ